MWETEEFPLWTHLVTGYQVFSCESRESGAGAKNQECVLTGWLGFKSWGQYLSRTQLCLWGHCQWVVLHSIMLTVTEGEFQGHGEIYGWGGGCRPGRFRFPYHLSQKFLQHCSRMASTRHEGCTTPSADGSWRQRRVLCPHQHHPPSQLSPSVLVSFQ